MDYLALFMEYLQVELGLSDNTRISYQRDLRTISGICGSSARRFPFRKTSWQMCSVPRLSATLRN